MKILIDMQGAQTPFSAKRGVGTYVDGIVREFQALATNHDVEYLFNAEFPSQYFDCLSRFEGIVTRANSHLFTQRLTSGYRSAHPSQIRLAEAFYASFVESLRPDALFSPNLQEGLNDKAVTAFAAGSARFAQIATLHDLVPFHVEEYLEDEGTRSWYERKIADAMKCDRIVTVSESSKADIQRFLGVDEGQVRAIPNGFDARRYNSHSTAGEREVVGRFLGTDGKYVLYFGGADKHKNVRNLVEAYGALPAKLREEYALVLGGSDVLSAAEVTNAIAQAQIGPNTILPGFIPDALLAPVIRQASLFVFPSMYEGFGLPVIEAMACGAPTICSGTSSLAEVVGNPEATFNPFAASDIARHLHKALEDEGWREGLRKRGLKRSSDFSWRRSAASLIETIEETYDQFPERSRLTFISRRMREIAADQDPRLVCAAAAMIAETAPEPRAQRVYLDVSSVALYGGHSGIQRVVREFARYLPDAFADKAADVLAIYAPEGSEQFRRVDRSVLEQGASVNPASDPVVDFAPSDILLFLDLHPGLAIRMESSVQRMRALGVRVYHIVYDILPVLMPEKFWPELQQEFYRWLQSISRSDGLLCISRTVAEQTADYLGKFGVKRPDRLTVGHFNLGSDFKASQSTAKPEAAGQPARCDDNQLNFLVVGTLEPRKAHEQTLQAFEQAWQEGESWNLTFVGREGWKTARLAHAIRSHRELGRRLFWHEKADDDLLTQLYAATDCVICPSEGEGFGLPLVEAARAGKPLIARDIPVFREVAKDGAHYFTDSRRPETLVRALRDWVAAHAADAHPRADATASTWQEAASLFALMLQQGGAPLVVEPRGAIDLRNPIEVPNPNVRTVGFYDREGESAWTAARAFLEFETIEPYDTVAVELECFSWRPMPFAISLGGIEVYSGDAAQDRGVHHFSFSIPTPGKHKIQIDSHAADTPPSDQRVLGIGIRRLKMFARIAIPIGEWVNVSNLSVVWEGFSDVRSDWRQMQGKRAAIEFELAEDRTDARVSIFGRASEGFRTEFRLNGTLLHDHEWSSQVECLTLPPARVVRGTNRLEVHVRGSAATIGRGDEPVPLSISELRIGSPDNGRKGDISGADKVAAPVRGTEFSVD